MCESLCVKCRHGRRHVHLGVYQAAVEVAHVWLGILVLQSPHLCEFPEIMSSFHCSLHCQTHMLRVWWVPGFVLKSYGGWHSPKLSENSQATLCEFQKRLISPCSRYGRLSSLIGLLRLFRTSLTSHVFIAPEQALEWYLHICTMSLVCVFPCCCIILKSQLWRLRILWVSLSSAMHV